MMSYDIGKCPSGHYSTDGYHPCTRCAIGSYQYSSGKTFCTQCPNRYTTLSTGATNVLKCVPAPSTTQPTIKTCELIVK